MKRVFVSTALIFCLLFALAACGGEQTDGDVTAQVQTQSPTEPAEAPEAASDSDTETTNATETNEPVDTLQGTDWNTAYQEFILQKGWLKAEKGEDLGEGTSAVVFLLHDLDGDGVPEVLARNEVANFGEMGNYVYAWDGSKMVFLGEIGFLGGPLWESDTRDYPGLFHYAGRGDSYLGHYYDLKDGQLRQTLVVTDGMVPLEDGVSCESTVETEDNDLYMTYSRTKGNDALPMYTADEISAMSWESFAR